MSKPIVIFHLSADSRFLVEVKRTAVFYAARRHARQHPDANVFVKVWVGPDAAPLWYTFGDKYGPNTVWSKLSEEAIAALPEQLDSGGEFLGLYRAYVGSPNRLHLVKSYATLAGVVKFLRAQRAEGKTVYASRRVLGRLEWYSLSDLSASGLGYVGADEEAAVVEAVTLAGAA